MSALGGRHIQIINTHKGSWLVMLTRCLHSFSGLSQFVRGNLVKLALNAVPVQVVQDVIVKFSILWNRIRLQIALNIVPVQVVQDAIVKCLILWIRDVSINQELMDHNQIGLMS